MVQMCSVLDMPITMSKLQQLQYPSQYKYFEVPFLSFNVVHFSFTWHYRVFEFALTVVMHVA